MNKQDLADFKVILYRMLANEPVNTEPEARQVLIEAAACVGWRVVREGTMSMTEDAWRIRGWFFEEIK